MRKHVAIVAFVVVGVSAQVSVGTQVIAAPAIPTSPTANPPPGPHIVPPGLLNIRRTPAANGDPVTTYSDGPISYDVEIGNPSSSPLKTELTIGYFTPIPGLSPTITKVPVTVDANTRAWVTFVFPGLSNACTPLALQLSLATGPSRKAVAKPTCSFTTSEADKHNTQNDGMRRNKISYVDPSLTSAPKCGQAFSVKATIVNASTTKANDARLLLDVPGSGEPAGSMSTKVDLDANKSSAPLTVTHPSEVTKPGMYTLKIIGGGAPEYQPGWQMKVARSCSLAIAFE